MITAKSLYPCLLRFSRTLLCSVSINLYAPRDRYGIANRTPGLRGSGALSLIIVGLYGLGYWQQAFLYSVHDICGRLLLTQLPRHVIHIGSRMLEKAPVALAEVIQTGLTVGSFGKTVLGAFAIAKLQPLALLALPGQLLDLHLCKFLLLRAIEHLYERVVVDVA